MPDLTPVYLGNAAALIRRHLETLGFHEVSMSPFDAYPIDYRDDTVEVAGVGQLRFNTEPEIWQAAGEHQRFFSISSLFRREPSLNILRRSSFYILDFYQPGPPDDLLAVFLSLLHALRESGHADILSNLPLEHSTYDPINDGPVLASLDTRWVVTHGYDADHSFFEVDDNGQSTRREVFLVTPKGILEIAGMGIVGRNLNARYRLRGPGMFPCPPAGISGMGVGLERLLLAEQILRGS